MAILTSISGNTLEWYDFALYGYFASVLAKIFFPVENHFISLMLTFSVFASGFVIRPLGGAIFGHIGDKYGRRLALVSSIALITIPTTLMGLLPSYHTIGLLAPIFLTILRLLQGLAVSGELTGSGAFLVESSPNKQRGFFGSLIMCSTYVGLLIGSAVGAMVTILFNADQIIGFAWRIPFLISAIFGVIAFILRLKCCESPLFIQAKKESKLLSFPVNTGFKNYWVKMLWVCFVSSSLAVAIYLIIGYLPTFFDSIKGMGLKETMIISFVGLLVLTVMVPCFGALSDKIDNKKVLGFGACGFILFSYPIFEIANQGGVVSAIISELLLVAFLAPVAGSLISLLSEAFPTNVRYTGTSIGYNASMAIFGGTTPLISVYLTRAFDSNIAPAYYLIFCGIITLLGLFGLSGKVGNRMFSLNKNEPNEVLFKKC